MSKKKQPAEPSGTHTAGDWAFTVGDKERRNMSTVHKADDETFLIAYVICEAVNPHQRAEDVANARLLAASPRLLAACRHLIDILPVLLDKGLDKETIQDA